jgi:hypothetical protein
MEGEEIGRKEPTSRNADDEFQVPRQSWNPGKDL